MKTTAVPFFFFLLFLIGLTGSCSINQPLGPFHDGKNNPVASHVISYTWDNGTVLKWYAEPINTNHNNGFSVFPLEAVSSPALGSYALSVHATLVDRTNHGSYQNGIIWVDLDSPIDLSNKSWKVSLNFEKVLHNGWDGYKFCFKDSSSAWIWGQTYYSNFKGTAPAINTWVTFSNSYAMIDHLNSPGFNPHSVTHLGFQLCGGWGNGLVYDGKIRFDNYELK